MRRRIFCIFLFSQPQQNVCEKNTKYLKKNFNIGHLILIISTNNLVTFQFPPTVHIKPYHQLKTQFVKISEDMLR